MPLLIAPPTARLVRLWSDCASIEMPLTEALLMSLKLVPPAALTLALPSIQAFTESLTVETAMPMP